MKQILITFIASALLLLACEHEVPEPVEQIHIEGISYTDVNGNPMASPDPGDWTSDQTWTAEEARVLLYEGMTEFKQTAPNDSNKISVSPAYPNPVNSGMSLQIKRSKSTKMKLVLVDETLKQHMCLEQEFVGPGTSSLSFDLSKLKPGYYRFYYIFMNGKSEYYYRGHGDIEKL